MSTFIYDNKKIFYTIVGSGKPLLILNGIMMSTASWKVLLDELSKNRQVILMDFVDQGASDRAEGESYNHQLQVDLVIALMKELKHSKYDLFGISYGGQVALQVAIAAPELIRKLAVFNAAAYTTPWLRDIGRAWIKTAKTYDADSFYLVTIPYIYSNSFYTEQIDWMENRRELLKGIFNRNFLDAMVRLIISSEDYDVRDDLKNINCPTLIVGCESDYLTPPNETKALSNEIKNSLYMEIANCGHASMYEKPETFIMLLNGFLSIDKEISVVG